MYVRALVVVLLGIVLAINQLWIPAAVFVLLAVMVLALSSRGREDRMG